MWYRRSAGRGGYVERQQAYQVVLQATRISPKPQYLLSILLQFCALVQADTHPT